MARRLPPLNALKAFEAAARYLSFTKAAEELHVTQAAVSHQVKLLEDYLGVRLFRRLNRALRLTEQGQQFLPAISKALDGVHEATRDILNADTTGPLTVSALPSFTARWLVPRLGDFRRKWSDIDLRIHPTANLTDFHHGDVDVGIRYGRGQYPGLQADWLMPEDIFPVCSPSLLVGKHPLKKPADLAHHTLIHDDGHGDWRTWLLAAGASNVDPSRGLVITDSGMLVDAAVSGQGVALARSVLASDALKDGTLVRPFKMNLPTEFAYYFVCPIDRLGEPKIAAFRAWLREAAAAA